MRLREKGPWLRHPAGQEGMPGPRPRKGRRSPPGLRPLPKKWRPRPRNPSEHRTLPNFHLLAIRWNLPGFRRLGSTRKTWDLKTVWKRVKERVLDILRKEEMEQDLFSSCVILRNLAIVQKDRPMSVDYILEELMNSSGALRSVYEEILFQIRNGRGDRAFDVLRERLNTRAGEQFAYVLAGIEQINPAELVGAMESLEEAFSEARVTAAMKRSSRRSFLTTLAATASVLAVLMNFSVVVEFMDMRQILSGMGSA